MIHEAEYKLFDPRAIRRTNPVLRQALALHTSGFELDFRWPGLNVEIDGEHHDRARTRRDDRIQDAVLRRLAACV